MSYHILVIRDTYTSRTTVGKMYVNGEYFGHTLEDTTRGRNVKVYGETAIPEGTYKLSVTMSSRFKREMPMIYSEDNGYELINEGISFKGIRIHGGNDHTHTHGCILVAENRLNDELIQGTLERKLTAILKDNGGDGWITIINK